MEKYLQLKFFQEGGQVKMIFKHILGVINFKATGLNTISFLNKIRESNFICKNLYTKNNEVFGKIYGSSYNKLSEIAEQNNMQVEIIKKKGLVYKILPYKRRFGIAIGVIFSIAIITLLSNTILKIKITGCDGEIYNNVMAVLNANGVKPGKMIPPLNFDDIEMNIITNVNNVSWASVRSSGGIITVNINEATPKPYVVPKRLPCNLISTRDAQIINFQIYQGQLMVLKGDGVKKGDLLVSGFIMDKNGKPLYFHSQAKIIGQYTENINIVQPLKEDKKIESDKSIKRNSFNFFSLKIPMYIGDKIKDEHTYSERTNYFSFFSLKLPLGITHQTYNPYETKSMEYTAEQAKELALNKINIYEKNFLNTCTIISKNVSENITENSVEYKVNYVVQGDITKENEILIKN